MGPGVGRLDWIHVFIDVPAAAVAATRRFWSDVLGWPTGESWAGHPEFVTFVARAGDEYVHVQEVDDAPRIHVDVVVDDLDAARDHLRGMGARPGLRTSGWQVMSSPGGLPFCLCLEPRRRNRPPATHWPDGHRSRLVQVCLDVPDATYDNEEEFWVHLTGWHHGRTGRPELARLTAPGDASVQLLLQRLEPSDRGTTTRAHIDLGTDDIAAEVARIEGHHGRTLDDTSYSWVVMEDPAGLPFCVTGQPPD